MNNISIFPSYKIPFNLISYPSSSSLTIPKSPKDSSLTEHFSEADDSTLSFTKECSSQTFLQNKRYSSNTNISYIPIEKCKVNDCECSFNTQIELKEHMIQSHHEVFKCSFAKCGFQFDNQENLFKHYKTHIQSRKKFECPFPGCGKRFTASYNQKIHFRIHTGERPYKCDKCENAYYDRANYKYHIKTAHLEIDVKDSQCSHKNCKRSFKSKKQKLIHHEKIEIECTMEKRNILKLLLGFQNAISNLEEKYKNIIQSTEYKNVQKQNNKIKNYLLDTNQFDALVIQNNA